MTEPTSQCPGCALCDPEIAAAEAAFEEAYWAQVDAETAEKKSAETAKLLLTSDQKVLI